MYHFVNDRTVPKRAPSYHKNAEGPFYVSDMCITCGLPIDTAPDNIDWDCSAGCEDCVQSCYVKKQPESEEELKNMIEAMLGSEVQNIRYCGTHTMMYCNSSVLPDLLNFAMQFKTIVNQARLN